MKKYFSGTGIAVIVFLLIGSMALSTACRRIIEEDDDVSVSVTIFTSTGILVPGQEISGSANSTIQFTAMVTGDPSNSVFWGLTGNTNSATKIDTFSGLLTVGGEPADTVLTVTAYPQADMSKAVTVKVRITGGSGPVVTDLITAPSTSSINVPQGGTYQFTASENANWTISSGLKTDTKLSAASGTSTTTLTVAEDEPVSTVITITATAVGDSSKTASRTVYVTTGGTPPDPGDVTVVRTIYSNGTLTGTLGDWAGSINATTPDSSEGGGYGTNTKSMKIVAGEEGWYGTEITMTSNLAFNTVNALSFWVKSSAEMKIAKVGFALGSAQQIQYMGEDKEGVPVTGEWTNVIIPVPSAIAGSTGNGFHIAVEAEEIGNKTLYIDKIEFISTAAAVTVAQIGIKDATDGDGIQPSATVQADALTGDVWAMYAVAGKFATLYDYVDWDGGDPAPVNTFSVWHTLAYTVTGDASLVGTNRVQANTPGGTFTLTLSFGGATSNIMNGKIAQDTGTYLIEGFDSMALGEYNVGTYWYDPKPQSTGAVIDTDSHDGGQCVQFGYCTGGRGPWPGGIGNSASPISLAGYTKITFRVKANRTGDSYRMGLGSLGTANFTVPTADTWVKIELDTSSFSAGSSNEWQIAVNDTDPGGNVPLNGQLLIDTIQLEK